MEGGSALFGDSVILAELAMFTQAAVKKSLMEFLHLQPQRCRDRSPFAKSNAHLRSKQVVNHGLWEKKRQFFSHIFKAKVILMSILAESATYGWKTLQKFLKEFAKEDGSPEELNPGGAPLRGLGQGQGRWVTLCSLLWSWERCEEMRCTACAPKVLAAIQVFQP